MIDFLRRYKYYLMVPTVLLLLALGVLMWMSRGGDASVPFIYQISGIGGSTESPTTSRRFPLERG